MKKLLLLSFAAILFATTNAQKKDSVMVQITLDTTTYKQLLYTIDTQIDSKKVTAALIELLQKNAQLVADKPKQIVAPKKKD